MSFNVEREDLDLASLVEIVFSWTFNDVRNQNFCRHKVFLSLVRMNFNNILHFMQEKIRSKFMYSLYI